ncbi:MAG: hypothetical protein RH859_09650 [Longimicrobiales bacterium]
MTLRVATGALLVGITLACGGGDRPSGGAGDTPPATDSAPAPAPTPPADTGDTGPDTVATTDSVPVHPDFEGTPTSELPDSVFFRGLGQEPGWILNMVRGGRIHLVYAYGEEERHTRLPEATTDASGVRIYRAETEAGSLVVRIVPERCYDAMSARPYATTVEIEVDGASLRGCGTRMPR